MEKDDKGSTMIRMGVSGWMFLLVPAYPGCPGSKAVKRSLLLLLFHIKYPEAIRSNSTRKLSWFEITKTLIAVICCNFRRHAHFRSVYSRGAGGAAERVDEIVHVQRHVRARRDTGGRVWEQRSQETHRHGPGGVRYRRRVPDISPTAYLMPPDNSPPATNDM